MRILDVLPYGELSVPLDVTGRRVALDARAAGRGYFSVALSNGELVLRAGRYVGLIPFSPEFAVRVTPTYGFDNFSRMLLRSGQLPTSVIDLPEGTLPLFAPRELAYELHFPTLLTAVEAVVADGLTKSYQMVANPPPWRGRLLVADTFRRFAARGVRHRASFENHALTFDVPANRLLAAALVAVASWLKSRSGRDAAAALVRTRQLLSAFVGIDHEEGAQPEAVSTVQELVSALPSGVPAYPRAMWAAYAVLQSLIPELGSKGGLPLDSLVIDAAKVFESYLLDTLRVHANGTGVEVVDGNRLENALPFFRPGGADGHVKPDFALRRGGRTVLLDAKHKDAPTEADRYELLAGLESASATVGAFVCPKRAGDEAVELMGTTASGRRMYTLRIDLTAVDIFAEEMRFARVAYELLG